MSHKWKESYRITRKGHIYRFRRKLADRPGYVEILLGNPSPVELAERRLKCGLIPISCPGRPK